MISQIKRDEIVDAFLAKCKTVLHEKGLAYAGPDDVLAFFKSQADDLGQTKYQVIATMLAKHNAAIREAVKANPRNPVEATESMEGRIMDVINFCLLLLCALREDEEIRKQAAMDAQAVAGPDPTAHSGEFPA